LIDEIGEQRLVVFVASDEAADIEVQILIAIVSRSPNARPAFALHTGRGFAAIKPSTSIVLRYLPVALPMKLAIWLR
jgi:hypothetical protein